MSKPTLRQSLASGRFDARLRAALTALALLAASAQVAAQDQSSEWTGFRDIGGAALSSPALVSPAADERAVFIADAEGAVWWRRWIGSGWSEWERIGGSIKGGPAAVAVHRNRIDLVGRGQNDHLWHNYWNGVDWRGWRDIGGSLSSPPAITSSKEGHLEVFASGNDGMVWWIRWEQSRWTPWERIGGIIKGRPGATALSADRIDVVGRGQNDHLWHNYWNGERWRGWRDVGGILSGPPAAATTGRSQLDFFAAGQDDAVWWLRWTGSAWTNWKRIGGRIQGGPAVASMTGRDIQVAVRGMNNHLWLTRTTGSEQLVGVIRDIAARADLPAPVRLESGDRIVIDARELDCRVALETLNYIDDLDCHWGSLGVDQAISTQLTLSLGQYADAICDPAVGKSRVLEKRERVDQALTRVDRRIGSSHGFAAGVGKKVFLTQSYLAMRGLGKACLDGAAARRSQARLAGAMLFGRRGSFTSRLSAADIDEECSTCRQIGGVGGGVALGHPHYGRALKSCWDLVDPRQQCSDPRGQSAPGDGASDDDDEDDDERPEVRYRIENEYDSAGNLIGYRYTIANLDELEEGLGDAGDSGPQEVVVEDEPTAETTADVMRRTGRAATLGTFLPGIKGAIPGTGATSGASVLSIGLVGSAIGTWGAGVLCAEWSGAPELCGSTLSNATGIFGWMSVAQHEHPDWFEFDNDRQCPAFDLGGGNYGLTDPGDGQQLDDSDALRWCACTAMGAYRGRPSLDDVAGRLPFVPEDFTSREGLCPDDSTHERLMCLTNPLGPDDKPRPECLGYLRDDNTGLTDAQIGELCKRIDCPAFAQDGHALWHEDGTLDCYCAADGVMPLGGMNPDASRSCQLLDCGPDGTKVFDGVRCRCAPESVPDRPISR